MAENNQIMVVEDNDFVRMQIVKFLNDDNYETIESTDGRSALDDFNEDIALAIVDLRMEPLDGFEFIRALRAQDLETPVILVTGDQNPDILSQASRLGVAAVLMKPVEKGRLIKTVARTLQNRKPV